MKKMSGKLLTCLVLLLTAVLLLTSCGGKSQNSKLGLQAMNEGDYDRAKRLYNFAIEKGEADSEDKKIYEVICAYIDAQRSLKAEEFTQGLAIIDGCGYDYSSLSIKNDMDKLYNQLSDGKYADERIRSLSEVTEAGNLERARGMIDEINRLNLTTAQQERLDKLSQEVAQLLTTDEAGKTVVYYADRPEDGTIPMYSEADEESDIITEIPGMEPIEVQGFAESGFISVVFDKKSGYVKSSDIVSSMPTYKENEEDKDNNDGKTDAEGEDSDGEKDGKKDGADGKNTDKSGGEKPPVEAISADDELHAITAVNLRTESNTDCEVIDTIPAGAEVTYLGEMEHGFYKVEYNGKKGYAYSDYLQK